MRCSSAPQPEVSKKVAHAPSDQQSLHYLHRLRGRRLAFPGTFCRCGYSLPRRKGPLPRWLCIRHRARREEWMTDMIGEQGATSHGVVLRCVGDGWRSVLLFGTPDFPSSCLSLELLQLHDELAHVLLLHLGSRQPPLFPEGVQAMTPGWFPPVRALSG